MNIQINLSLVSDTCSIDIDNCNTPSFVRPKRVIWEASKGCSIFSAMSASDELAAKLTRRQTLNDVLESGGEVDKQYVKVHKNVYTEFAEFSRKEIKEYETKFKS